MATTFLKFVTPVITTAYLFRSQIAQCYEKGSQPNSIEKCASVLDNSPEWSIEYSNLDKREDCRGCDRHRGCQNGPRLQITRLNEKYKDEEGIKSPYIRMIAFLPGTNADDVCKWMCDPRLRMRWDETYKCFEKFDEDNGEKVFDQGPERPLYALPKTPLCDGGGCMLELSLTGKLVEDAWFSHRMCAFSPRFLRRPDRLFFYRRKIFEYHTPGSDFTPMMDVLYEGTAPLLKQKCEQSNLFQQWVKSQQKAKFYPAWMHYQHACYIPITNFEGQLTRDVVQKIQESGSMFDKDSTTQLWKLYRESEELTKKGDVGTKGTLLILTSANDAGVPWFVPRCPQTRVMTYHATRNFEELMKLLSNISPKNGR